ncbi:MAG: ComEA family DNA-binding protein [Clostridiales bacterium]|nr:ComEA family DNA-binding protein [Clostridiales bacterium]
MRKIRARLNIKSAALFKVIMAVAIGVIAILGVVYVNVLRSEPAIIVEAAAPEADAPAPYTTTPAAIIIVYVSGHVYSPGVFEFPRGARIWQAIEAAGGMTAYADENAINLAAEMADGQHIIVFGIADNMPPSSDGATAAVGGPVNINTATAEQLQTLSGIGEARARDIISHREARGGFANIEEIMNVPGIGEGIFERIREFITV